MITDSSVLTFAISEKLLTCEVGITKDMCKKVIENRKTFSDDAQKEIEIMNRSIEGNPEEWFSIIVSKQEHFEDVMRVLAWERENRQE